MTTELENSKEAVSKLTIGAVKLDQVLSLGRPNGDKHGLGFTEDIASTSKGNSVFVRAGHSEDSMENDESEIQFKA